MKNLITSPENISPRLLMLRNQPVLLDSDVAAIFGVETKRVNEAVRRNSEKFPKDYMFTLENQEIAALRSQIATSNTGRGGSRYEPKAFTEKGLYMLATILKSKQAVAATFGIIETYAQVRELQSTLTSLHNNGSNNRSLMTRFSELLSDIVLPELKPDEAETSIELNFFIGKIKHTVKRKRRDNGPDLVEEPEETYGNNETESPQSHQSETV
ncbi:MAG: ORF6N domain-containing protein [Muribaculaceae bacterium]|nr:ORF6N domain-containing protein [Muribaculaceae bacterium]